MLFLSHWLSQPLPAHRSRGVPAGGAAVSLAAQGGSLESEMLGGRLSHRTLPSSLGLFLVSAAHRSLGWDAPKGEML